MAQSIKLGNDTYLDPSGVVVDSSGTTLKNVIDNQITDSSNQNIGTAWTETGISVTIPRTGKYVIYAELYYSNTRPSGVAICTKDTYISVLAKEEYDGATFGLTVQRIRCTAFAPLSKDVVVKLYAKSVTAASNLCTLVVKEIL